MVERIADYTRPEGEASDGTARPAGRLPAPPDLVDAAALRQSELTTQSFGGYRQGEVDELLERAAFAIEHHQATVASLRAEIETARAARAASETVVSDMLVTAQRVIEVSKEEARRDSAELIARAQADADKAAQLLADAQAELAAAHTEAARVLEAAQPEAEAMLASASAEADARRAAARAEAESIQSEADALLSRAGSEAETMTSSAQREAESLTSRALAEHDRLIAASTQDAEQARAALVAEMKRIETAIEELRRSWTNRLNDALGRLEGATRVDGPSDLADELHDRVGDNATPPSATQGG